MSIPIQVFATIMQLISFATIFVIKTSVDPSHHLVVGTFNYKCEYKVSTNIVVVNVTTFCAYGMSNQMKVR
jgi:hypothetical protein